ncbi:complement component receptor 1-like protein [Ciona intestinalis]
MSSLTWIAIVGLICIHLVPCEGNIWDILRPKFCSPSIPRRPLNGGFSCSYVNHACVSVRYYCHSGYKLQGENFNACFSRTWLFSSPPRCVEEGCDAPTLRNGDYSPRRSNHRASSVITIRCDDGYKPRSRHSICRRRYGSNYYWSPSPYCTRDAKCDPPNLRNGNYSPLRSKYNRNTAITVTCRPGYKTRSRDSLSYCRGNSYAAYWEPLPFCFSTVCNDPVAPTNGRAIPETRISWRVNSTVKYDCNNEFKLVGQNSSYCQESGSFAGSLPSCVRLATCPTPIPPTNGRMEPRSKTTWRETDRVSFYCDVGFTPVGADAATCGADGQWDNVAPTCAEEAVVEVTTGSGDA